MRSGKCIAGAVLGVVLAAWGTVGTAWGAVLADSQDGFSGVQGTNGWNYGYLDSGGTHLISQYNPSNNLWGYASAGAWEGPNELTIAKEGQHPGGLGQVAGRQWTSTYNGLVRISGQIAKFDTSSDSNSDGIDAYIYVNDVQKYAHYLVGTDGVGVNYSLFASVQVGDAVAFAVDRHGSYFHDSTKFTATIAAAEATTVDLANIVGGGNGHGTLTVNGYNLATGAQGLVGGDYAGDGFHAVSPINSLINGVFVPNPTGTNTTITSTGTTVDISGVTASHQWFGVRNTAANTGANNGILDGVNYDNANGHTLIQMHANGGITFDLDAIRAANPLGLLTSFSTVAGLATSNTGPIVEAGFQIFIDGVLKGSHNIVSTDEIGKGFAISQSITDSDHYLTLVSTDINSFNSDGIIFADPRLSFIPEPSTLVLLACGLICLLAYTWRKRR